MKVLNENNERNLTVGEEIHTIITVDSKKVREITPRALEEAEKVSVEILTFYGWKIPSKLKCKECGEEFYQNLNSLCFLKRNKQCSCGRKETIEDEIYNYVRSVVPEDIEIRRRMRGIIGNRKELDIYIPRLKIAIEVNESSHKHKYFAQFEKTKLCSGKGISLIHIFDFEWKEDDGYCKRIIDYHLGNDRGEGLKKEQIHHFPENFSPLKEPNLIKNGYYGCGLYDPMARKLGIAGLAAIGTMVSLIGATMFLAGETEGLIPLALSSPFLVEGVKSLFYRFRRMI